MALQITASPRNAASDSSGNKPSGSTEIGELGYPGARILPERMIRQPFYEQGHDHHMKTLIKFAATPGNDWGIESGVCSGNWSTGWAESVINDGLRETEGWDFFAFTDKTNSLLFWNEFLPPPFLDELFVVKISSPQE
jgi:hypothetical protein